MMQKPIIRRSLLAMAVGQVETVPFGTVSSNYLRNCASLIRYDAPGRRYSVHADQAAGVFRVTRTA